jgi:hypothetical protein
MGEHASHDMRENSRQAYAAAHEILRGRKRAVINALHQVGSPLTDRQIAAHLGLGRDGVQPRVSDLIDDRILVEVDRVECPITGHEVRRVWFALALHADGANPLMVPVGVGDASGVNSDQVKTGGPS